MTDDTTRDEDLREVLRDLQRLRGFASPLDPAIPAPPDARVAPQAPGSPQAPVLGHCVATAYDRPSTAMLDLERLTPTEEHRLWRDVWVAEARMLRWYANRLPKESIASVPGSRSTTNWSDVRRELVQLESEDDGSFGVALTDDHPGVRTLALWQNAGLDRVAVQEQIGYLTGRYSGRASGSHPPLLRGWERVRDQAEAIIVERSSRLVVWVVNDAIRDATDRRRLFASGMGGLRQAIRRYDGRRNASLSTYATIWIRQRVRRTKQDESLPLRRPAHLFAHFGRLRRAEVEHMERHAGPATIGDLAMQSGLGDGEIAKVLRAFLPAARPTDRASGVSATVDDRLVDDTLIDPATLAAYRAFLRLLDEIVAGLGRFEVSSSHGKPSRRATEIVCRRLPYGHAAVETLDALGARVGVSPERIRQLQMIGERRLADRLGRAIRARQSDAPSWPFQEAPSSVPATS